MELVSCPTYHFRNIFTIALLKPICGIQKNMKHNECLSAYAPNIDYRRTKRSSLLNTQKFCNTVKYFVINPYLIESLHFEISEVDHITVGRFSWCGTALVYPFTKLSRLRTGFGILAEKFLQTALIFWPAYLTVMISQFVIFFEKFLYQSFLSRFRNLLVWQDNLPLNLCFPMKLLPLTLYWDSSFSSSFSNMDFWKSTKINGKTWIYKIQLLTQTLPKLCYG